MENLKKANRSALTKKRKSLRLHVVSTYITVSLVTIGVIFVIILSSWKASVNDAITRLKEDSNKHIYAEIDSLTNLPLSINEANHHILENSILDLQNPNTRDAFFAGVVISSGEDIYSFSYGTANGEYYGARRNAENKIEVYHSDSDTEGHSLYYSVNEDLSADVLVNDYGPFDPRTRDWYKIAAQTGRPVFSPLYKHFIKDDFALTAAHPIYDKEGKLKGVLGTHIILSKLNSVLKAHISDIHAETYIIEKSTGELVANSNEKPNLEILSNGTVRRINIGEVCNKAVIASYQDFLETGQSDYVRKDYKDKLYINITEYKKEGLEWLILTSIPESQFIVDMNKKIQIALLLTLIVLIISSIIYYKLTDIVLKPIRHLVSIAGKFSSGDLLARAIVTRNDEIGDLAEAYNQMAKELYDHIHYLEARISEHTSELENANAALKKNEESLRLLLDSTTEGILGIDLNERFTFCNESCLRLLGYQQEDLIGKNLHYQIHYQTEEESPIPLETCRIYKAVTKGEKMYSDSEVLWRADGTCFPIELYSYPQYRDGEPVGAVLTFIDITERKIAQKELIQAKEQAESANIAKSQFLASMSHEIRTPMNGIMGFLQLLESTELTEDQADYVQTIKTSSDVLMAVINDILDISKIEAGRMDLEKIPFILRNIIESGVILFDAKARSKGLTLDLDIDPSVPQYVIGDPTRIRQIIINLVSNAVKFTERGGVSVKVFLAHETDASVTLSFSVTDTGIGIAETQINKLFQAFSQADSSSTRKFGGTGLGLTICKRLVTLMDGEISVTSALGKGSAFHFNITLYKADEKEYGTDCTELTNVESRAKKNTVHSNNIKILLAEDNELNVKFFLKLLQSKGLSCDVAANGEEAVKAYKEKKYSIIFMDCQMPLMDGYEATRQIRSFENNQRHAIIVAMTAYSMEGDDKKCLQAGMDEYISKPAKLEQIMNILYKYITLKEADIPGRVDYETFSEILLALSKESGFDRDLCEELLYDFCEQAVQLLERLQKNLQEGNYLEVCRLLHQLKGSSGTVRAKKIEACAAKAEDAAKNMEYDKLSLQIPRLKELVTLLNNQRGREA